MGLARYPKSEFWRAATILTLVIAALTHLIYPIAYNEYLGGQLGMALVGVARNGAVVGLFLASLVRLWRLGTRPGGAHKSGSSPVVAVPKEPE